MRSAGRLVQHWPDGSQPASLRCQVRHDVVDEIADDHQPGVFVQRRGPFTHYRRTLHTDAGETTETIEYRMDIPWFAWLLHWPVRHTLRRPRPDGAPPWWSPPDRLDSRQVRVLALLAAASFTAVFANTLFTQTVSFAADSFRVGSRGQGIAGVVVRLGVVIALPFTVLADRVGRRRILVGLAWVTPVGCAIGAAAPSFAALVVSQTVARPLGLAMSALIAVVATEEVPRNSRAYGISVITMAGGFGAGIAVLALKLADLGAEGWRLVYVVALIWLPVAWSLQRGLPETRRFAVAHPVTATLPRRRFAVIAAVSLIGNVFVAPVSYYQNRYLNHVRGYSAGDIAVFTLVTATPASIGLVLGGRIAERVGRRAVILVCLPAAAALLVGTYAVGGPAMWAMALAGGIIAGVSYPAVAVYRTELFPTGSRSRANGWITVAALAGGSAGLLGVGWALDHHGAFWPAMAVVAVFQLAAAVLAYAAYPETAHLTLEEINPGDPTVEP